jgi:hypothetical protein
MIEWMRFAIIVGIAATAHVLYELVLSFNTTRDFVWYRLRWVAREKLRAVWRRRLR